MILILELYSFANFHFFMFYFFHHSYGTLIINHERHIVTEWTEKGNLEDFLRSDQELLWPCRLKIAEQIANALEFIHRTEIYHHDVKR